jgi:hypothetical protein
MVGDTQSSGKPGSGGSVVSSEEDGPRVGHRWAERTGPKGRLGRTAWRHGSIPERNGVGHKKEWAEIRNGLQKPYSNLNQGFKRRTFKLIQKKFLKNEIQIFLKSKNNLGLRDKNMHDMKCNLSNYSKFSYCYLSEMHYLSKF